MEERTTSPQTVETLTETQSDKSPEVARLPHWMLSLRKYWWVAAAAAFSIGVAGAAWLHRKVDRLDRQIAGGLQELRSQRVKVTTLGESSSFYLQPEGSQFHSWVRIEQIPPSVAAAVIAVEDHRFFRHLGVDVLRTTKAALEGLWHVRRPRGTSTVTQQVARLLFLERERTLERKVRETILALRLEMLLKKEEILEIYLNVVPLGRVGPYPIRGLQQGAIAYFGKELSQVSLAEAALLAAMIQRPSYLNPRSHPEPAMARRNLVLRIMGKRGLADRTATPAAQREPLHLVSSSDDVASAGHYYQLARRELHSLAITSQALHVEMTLDPQLQKAAVRAVREGMKELDRKLGKSKQGDRRADAALVALDPETGAVRALVGGRDFTASQFNRAVAQRQPGSTFKPFVFAAALQFGTPDGPVGPDSLVDDREREFLFRGQPYTPSNYDGYTDGMVTLQEALNRSLNVPAVRLAEAVGYGRVADLARRAGFDTNMQGTPSLALGAYEVSPLALAAGYSIFANRGRAVAPYFVERVSTFDGQRLYQASHPTRQVINASTAAQMTRMLADVVNRGTAWPVRGRGFLVPAAGKTGTDDDGWFAGYTTRLICVVWVGYDDNTDLGLLGARSALPIWAEFMKTAHTLPRYRDAGHFPAAPGFSENIVDIDQEQPGLPGVALAVAEGAARP
jgi:penicillin-binding protein 1B